MDFSKMEPPVILFIIGLIMFLTPFIVIPLVMVNSSLFMCVPIAFIIAFIGFALMIGGTFLAKGSSFFSAFSFGQKRSRIPPVQYPRQTNMAIDRDTIEEIMCPSCGASPKYYDAHGLCMCEYCGAKYRVR